MVKIMSTLLTAWTRRPLAAADSLLKHALPLRLCLAAGGMLLLSLDPVACRAAEMAFPGEQWEIASPASQGIDGEKLAAAVDYLTAHAGRDGNRELIIIRNGRQVLAGDNVDKVHGICAGAFDRRWQMYTRHTCPTVCSGTGGTLSANPFAAFYDHDLRLSGRR